MSLELPVTAEKSDKHNSDFAIHIIEWHFLS